MAISDHQNRSQCVADKLLGDRADDQAADDPVASTPHDDGRRLAGACRSDQLCRRVAKGDIEPPVNRPPGKEIRGSLPTQLLDLTQAITTWAEHWNNNPTPFIWKATAEDIITKVKRGRETLNQIKTQTDH
jgi:hypothetical protein